MNTQIIQNLLNEISAITKKYEEIAEITGENFNVFRILKVESSEVHTHSAFLAELLNPQGSHGQKDTFLKIFINLFKFCQYAFKTQDATAEVEKYTGVINDDYTEGGRIDIVITDKSNRHIIIENKIYASDQRNQLIRYHNFDHDADLFYLTLYGDEPSDWSKGEKLHSGIEFKTISYHTDIINWLKLCHKESVDHPILRETITQYINLIKYLTGQTINDKMGKEIKDTMSQSFEVFKNAELIADSWPELRNDIERHFLNDLKNQWDLKDSIEKDPIHTYGEYEIYFEVITYDPEGLYYGFYPKKNGQFDFGLDKELDKLVKVLNEINENFKRNPRYIGWKYPENKCNFKEKPITKNTFNMLNESSRKKYINELIKEMEPIIEQFKEQMKKNDIGYVQI